MSTSQYKMDQVTVPPRSKELIVRVKRKRVDPPTQTLCILAGAQLQTYAEPGCGEQRERKKYRRSKRPAMDQLSLREHQENSEDLLGSQASVANIHSIKLHLSHTLSSRGERLKVEENKNTDDELTNNSQIISGDSNIDNSRNLVLITRGKSTLHTSSDRSTVMIDMQQMIYPGAMQLVSPDIRAVSEKESSTEQATEKSHSGVSNVRQESVLHRTATSQRVLDPINRLLDRGLVRAIEKGDFSDVSSALMQGADPNHQIAGNSKYAGFNALMAAAARCNVQMVQRLLMMRPLRRGNDSVVGVDTLAVNAEGKTALELISSAVSRRSAPATAEGPSASVSTASEIVVLLHNAMNKAYNAAAGGQNGFSTCSLLQSSDSEFVYDIFEVSVVDPSPTTHHTSEISSERFDTNKVIRVSVPELRVESSPEGTTTYGLEGEAEEMQYDSDWSDLGDDEDPDSNDERFVGNDYPEEEEEDEAEDDVAFYSTRNDSVDEDYDSDDAPVRQDRMRGVYSIPQNQAEASQRFSVGRVLKAHNYFPDGSAADGGYNLYSGSTGAELLRNLWGEGENRDEVRDTHSDLERIAGMNQRTGVAFASVPREFDGSSGLPKFGAELSDDEVCAAVYEAPISSCGDTFASYSNKPDGCTVAYDSDLDRSHSRSSND